jgi:peptidyl-prolyl cis-trans isomerase B (cyclophilin B)
MRRVKKNRGFMKTLAGSFLLAAATVSYAGDVQKNNGKENAVIVRMETSAGNITLKLEAEKAPKTVENFLKYVRSGHYDGTIFHRGIDGFMIQGGGVDAEMSQRPAPHTVENEADNGLKNKRGTIAMARTSDPHSAGAQFFINVKDNDFLNYTSKTPQGWGYCVFGEVVDGMDVVDQIKKVPTGRSGMFQDVPRDPIVIEKMECVEE